MLLFKDYSTGQKSFTVTGLVFTFLISLGFFIAILIKVIKGNNTFEDVASGFMALAFVSLFASLYWNKRVRASKDGLEVEGNFLLGEVDESDNS